MCLCVNRQSPPKASTLPRLSTLPGHLTAITKRRPIKSSLQQLCCINIVAACFRELRRLSFRGTSAVAAVSSTTPVAFQAKISFQIPIPGRFAILQFLIAAQASQRVASSGTILAFSSLRPSLVHRSFRVLPACRSYTIHFVLYTYLCIRPVSAPPIQELITSHRLSRATYRDRTFRSRCMWI